jgi:O-antigen ligase
VTTSSCHLRIPLAIIALEILASAPMGIGINSYAQVVPGFILNHAPYLIPSWYDVDNMVVHNLFLLVTAEMGPLGLLAFLWFLAALLRMAWRTAARGRGWLSPMGMGIACGVVAFMVAESVDYAYRVGQALPYLLYTWGAFMIAAEAVTMRQGRSESAPARHRGAIQTCRPR